MQDSTLNYSFCIKKINEFYFLYFQVIFIISSIYNKKVIALKIVFWCNNLYDLFLLALVYKVEIIGELRQRID